MYLRRSAAAKYCIGAFFGVALYSEWFVYLLQPLYWPELTCVTESCVRVLFIADPQLQGDYAEPPPLNYLYNWDSDRYLKSTFSVVVRNFKPEVLVFLGDLMDEGSISTMAQFHHYAKRLFNIFELDYPVVQIWLPGDNDIGGENEPIKKEKVAEFEKVFTQPSVVTYQNISFYKVNGITHTYPKQAEGSGHFRIVASHYPIHIRHGFGQQVNNEIRPNIYFCAHDHVSKFVRENMEDLTDRVTFPDFRSKDVLEIPLSDKFVYEIYVPTCSYRMGTTSIGYGAAVIDKDTFELKYGVFWSPGRFPYLILYLVLLILVLLYCLVYCVSKLHRQPMVWTTDKVPLLERI